VPAFSDKSLSVELPAVGIKYIHRPELGVPPEIVKSYTKSKTMSDEEFETYYRENHQIDGLEGRTVLLCACTYAVKNNKQKWNCHRSILAQMLVEAGQVKGITHL
jgi:uncharacterized protein (DUF488 family)